jgi:poly(A) polymerase
MSALLANVPLSRLFDEMIKLLQTGHALASIELKKQGLDRGCSRCSTPRCRRQPPPRAKFVRLALQDTDRRVAEGRRWCRASCWPACCGTTCSSAGARSARRRRAAVPGAAAGHRRGLRRPHRRHLRPRQAGRRHARDLADAAALRAPHAQRAASLVEQPRFRAGYDFLRLRADVGEIPVELADWWEDFHLGTTTSARRCCWMSSRRPRCGACPGQIGAARRLLGSPA